jgi:anti-sigma-K factor RskA
MSEPPDIEANGEALAAELVFGLLDGPERAAAIRRQLEDSRFASAVAYWRAVGEDWLERVEPAQVPPALAARVEQAIDEDAAPAVPARRFAVMRNLALVATAASLALSIGLLTILARSNGPRVERVFVQPANVAQIPGEGGSVLLSASYDPATGELRLRGEGTDAAGLAPELWVIPGDGKPRSLGFIEPGKSKVIAMPQRIQGLAGEGAALAVSIEAPGGSTDETGPRGPVAAVGKLEKI